MSEIIAYVVVGVLVVWRLWAGYVKNNEHRKGRRP